MIKRTTLVTIAFLALIQISKAQITLLELASGPKKTDFTSISYRPITPKENFTIATLAFFQKYHENENFMFDEAGVQPTLYWNINKALSVGPGLYYNSIVGFSERVSVLYAIRSPHFVLTAIPTIAHSEDSGFINGELFVQMQLTRPIKGEWEALISGQFLTYWDEFSRHARSFQQLRAGVNKKGFQFGLAIDFDQYGESPITKTSPGAFLRMIFQNNQ